MTYGAFVPGPAVEAEGAASGSLAGMTFAAKDLFDVAGLVTGCGNPDWARTHPPAPRHAWAVRRLLDAGAALRGRTITDEISLGLLGRNQFQGTPVNPRAPGRLPGGSSSGSAAAVAGGLVTCALGTDSGGSVRVPSSFTGLYGIRPTHGRIPVDGLMTQSPSFDTVGFFARSADVFEAVGQSLLGEDAARVTPARLLVATDAFAMADDAVAEALAPLVARLRAAFSASEDIILASEGLPVWRDHQRRLQQIEFAATFRDWIDRTNPRFSFEVGRSLALAALLTEADVVADRSFRREVTSRIDDLLGDTGVLCLPTVPILPPLRDVSLSAMAEAGGRIVTLTCIAGLTGLPQINLPIAETPDGIPVGLSLIGGRGGDRALLRVAATLSAGLQSQQNAGVNSLGQDELDVPEGSG
jgi:amidase